VSMWAFRGWIIHVTVGNDWRRFRASTASADVPTANHAAVPDADAAMAADPRRDNTPWGSRL